MEDYKLPITKLTLDLLYEALNDYRKQGTAAFKSDTLIKLMSVWSSKLEDASGDALKQTQILLSIPHDTVRAQQEAFKTINADLDITIARIQILRKKLEGQSDSAMIEDLFKEIL